MSNKIPTTEEYFIKRYKELNIYEPEGFDDTDISIVNELIKLHVQQFAEMLEESNITAKEYLELHVK